MATLRPRPGDPARVKTALELGVLIRAAREARGWTQAELADRANVGRQWLVAVEKGRHSRAEIGMLLRVIATVGVELSARLPEAAEPLPRARARTAKVKLTPVPPAKASARVVRTKKSPTGVVSASARVNLDDVLDRVRRG